LLLQRFTLADSLKGEPICSAEISVLYRQMVFNLLLGRAVAHHRGDLARAIGGLFKTNQAGAEGGQWRQLPLATASNSASLCGSAPTCRMMAVSMASG
jgi:hypothetical protein